MDPCELILTNSTPRQRRVVALGQARRFGGPGGGPPSFEVDLTGPCAVIRPLHPRRPVWLDGRRLTEVTPLSPGATIQEGCWCWCLAGGDGLAAIPTTSFESDVVRWPRIRPRWVAAAVFAAAAFGAGVGSGTRLAPPVVKSTSVAETNRASSTHVRLAGRVVDPSGTAIAGAHVVATARPLAGSNDVLGRARVLGARPPELWAAWLAAPDAGDVVELGETFTDPAGAFDLRVLRSALRGALTLAAGVELRAGYATGVRAFGGQDGGAVWECGEVTLRRCRRLDVSVTGLDAGNGRAEVFLGLGPTSGGTDRRLWVQASTDGTERVLSIPRHVATEPLRLLAVAPGRRHVELLLEPDEADAAVSVALATGPDVRAAVLDPAGAAIGGVTVSAAPVEDPWLVVARSVSGPDGELVLQRLRDGRRYRLSAEATQCGHIDTVLEVTAAPELPALRLDPALELAVVVVSRPSGTRLLAPREALQLERLRADGAWGPAELAREPGACSASALLPETLERELAGEVRFRPLGPGRYRVIAALEGHEVTTSEEVELSSCSREVVVTVTHTIAARR